jgi:holliday junction DNA helicase RuvA
LGLYFAKTRMITHLNGKLTRKTPTSLVMEIGGIGYAIKITLNTYTAIQHLEQGLLYTYLVVKVENQTVSGFDLYGFADELERDIFERMLSVSGIGASIARTMLSTFKPDEVRQAILTENEAMIQSVKGIGPKMAKRMILELKDRMGKPGPDMGIGMPRTDNTVREEALTALMALGFSKQAVDKLLIRLSTGQPGMTVEQMIKEALKIL